MNFKEMSRKIVVKIFDREEPDSVHVWLKSGKYGRLRAEISEALQSAYESGKAESKELIEILMVEKNNMLPPYEHTKMRELWEQARNHRQELMKKWRGE